MKELALVVTMIALVLSVEVVKGDEVDCIPNPQLEVPVCKDMPLGPRFWNRR
jgi:hypothetical protein